MVGFFDLVYDATGLEFTYWLFLLILMIILVVAYNYVKNKNIYHNNEELYKKSKDYLEKVEEYRRKPMPIFILLILVFMVIIEAIGFSYVFSEYLINDASNSDLRIAGVLGAILLASILVPLTHISGETVYYNKKIDTLDSYLMNRNDIRISEIKHLNIDNTYDDNNRNDRGYSVYARIEPEVKKGKFVRKRIMMIITLIVIAATALGAYKVREQTYLAMVKTETDKFESKQSNFNKDISNLPKFMIETARDNANIQNRGVLEAKRQSNLITYIVLMFMFIAIQVIGIFSGMNWGFVGKESKQAYLNMKNYRKAKK